MENIAERNIDINDSTNSNHYVKNADLLKELIISNKNGELTMNAIRMFELMISKIQSKKKYIDPDAMEDCRAQAIMDCLMYWKSFNPEKGSNPFGYFTSVITNGLAKGWNQLHPEDKKAEGAIFTSINNNIHSI